jgi:hypothetical protein
MRKSIRNTAIICILLVVYLSGCGIIGGAFTLPEEETAAAATASEGGMAGDVPTVPTPLPLQAVTPLPTGQPQLPAGCVDALSVSIDDYGKTMCVGGTVYLVLMEHGTYYVRFSPDRGTLYMQGEEWVDRIGLRKGECAYAEGKLSRNIQAAAPVMPITPYSLKRCPVAPSVSAPPRPNNLPADCAYALEVTRDDAGRKKCVGGTVAFSEWEDGVYKIYFFTDKLFGLHLVSSAWTGRGVNAGDCVYVADETIAVEAGTNTPILNVVPGNVTTCPD